MNTKKYKIAVTVVPLEDGTFIAYCESVRATAMGDTSEEAVRNLYEAIEEMVIEFGEQIVFQDVNPKAEVSPDARIFL
jgi:predicted RNase H-like HicB family nuclease